MHCLQHIEDTLIHSAWIYTHIQRTDKKNHCTYVVIILTNDITKKEGGIYIWRLLSFLMLKSNIWCIYWPLKIVSFTAWATTFVNRTSIHACMKLTAHGCLNWLAVLMRNKIIRSLKRNTSKSIYIGKKYISL